MKLKAESNSGWGPIMYEVRWYQWLWLKLTRRKLQTKITVSAKPKTYTLSFPDGVDPSLFTAGQRIKITRTENKMKASKL